MSGPSAGKPPLTVVCVHGNPTWSFLWRSFHPAPRRPLPRARSRPGLDGALGAHRPEGVRPSESTISDASSTRSRSTGRSSSRPTTGAARSLSAGRSSIAERVRGILLCNTGVALPATGVPLPIRVAGSRVLRDLVCRRTSLFVRATLATGRGRIGSERQARLPRALPIEPRRDARSPSSSPTFRRRPHHPSFAASAEVAARLSELDAARAARLGRTRPGLPPRVRRRPPAPAAAGRAPPLSARGAPRHRGRGCRRARRCLDRPAARARARPRPEPSDAHAAAEPEALWAALVAREDDDADGGLRWAVETSLSFAALAQRVADIAVGLRSGRRRPGRPRRVARTRSGRLHRGRLRLLGDRGRRRRRRPGPRARRASARAAERGATLAARHRARRWASPGCLRWAPRGTPARDRARCAAVGGRSCPTSSTARDPTPTRLRRSSSRQARPARPRASSTTSARWRPSSPPCASATPIGPDDRLVAAFAPFALYGPALGIPVAVPDCDITKPASLRADGPGRRVRRGRRDDPLRRARRPRRRSGLPASGSRRRRREALGGLRLVLSAGAPVPQRILEAFARPGPRRRAAHAVRHDGGAVGDGHRSGDARGRSGRAAACASVARSTGSGVRIEPLPGGDGASGEIVVSAPWLSVGYDGLWATTDQARTVDRQGVEWHRTG